MADLETVGGFGIVRIHVSGATGFVGRTLLDTISQRGHVSVALVRNSTEQLRDVERRVIGDITDSGRFSEALEGADAVIHLAARVHVMNETAMDSESLYDNTNRAATLRLAQAAVEVGVRRFVFVSSIKVNGDRTLKHPFSAESAENPLDAYARSKWRAEQELHELAAATGLEVVVIRPPVVYGPGVGGNIRRIAQAVARGIPLPFGSVRNQRTMIALDNLVSALTAAATQPSPPQRPVLVGDPRPLSTAELIELLARGMRRRARLVPVPTSLLRAAATSVGRGAVAERLFDDLVVDANWDDLGISTAQLAAPEDCMPEVGAWIAQRR